MYYLKLSVQESSAYRTLLEKSPSLLVLAQEIALSKAAITAAGLAQEFAPKRSGRLAASIGVKQAIVGLRIVATGADIPYAVIQEYGGVIRGTGERIYPKRAKVLRFVKTRGPEAGEVKFRKWVRSHDIFIPGHQYMLRAAASIVPVLRTLGDRAVLEVLRRASINVS